MLIDGEDTSFKPLRGLIVCHRYCIQYCKQYRCIHMCSLKLKQDEVDIYYKTYINNFKRALTANEESIQQAANDRLTLGRKFLLGIKLLFEIRDMLSCECQRQWITTCNGVGLNCKWRVHFQNIIILF